LGVGHQREEPPEDKGYVKTAGVFHELVGPVEISPVRLIYEKFQTELGS